MLQYQQPATDLNHTRPALSTLASIASDHDHSSHLRYVEIFFMCICSTTRYLYLGSISLVWFGSGEDDNRNEKRHAASTRVHVCMYVYVHVLNQLT